jgi:hypothetical protein
MIKDCPGCGVADGAIHQPGCLQKVVDDYLLMERKARAWDALYAKAMRDWDQTRLADMDALVHPAHKPST